jgi:hypothetical protein
VDSLTYIKEYGCGCDEVGEARCPSCEASQVLASLTTPAPPNPGEKEREAVIQAAIEHEGTCEGSCTGTMFAAALAALRGEKEREAGV